MKQSYTTDDLMLRYNVSRPAITKFINAHLKEINSDSTHAKKVGKDWHFDAEAIKIIDSLKNRGVTVVDDAMQADRLQELQEEITNLYKRLDAERDQKELAQQKIIALLEQNKNIALLEQTIQRAETAEATVKQLQKQAEAAAEEKGEIKARLQVTVEQLQQTKQEHEQQIQELKQQHEISINNISNINTANLKQIQDQQAEINSQHQQLAVMQTETARLRDKLKEVEQKSWWQKIFG